MVLSNKEQIRTEQDWLMPEYNVQLFYSLLSHENCTNIPSVEKRMKIYFHVSTQLWLESLPMALHALIDSAYANSKIFNLHILMTHGWAFEFLRG